MARLTALAALFCLLTACDSITAADCRSYREQLAEFQQCSEVRGCTFDSFLYARAKRLVAKCNAEARGDANRD